MAHCAGRSKINITFWPALQTPIATRDNRLTVSTPADTTVERHGDRASYTYQLAAFADHIERQTPLPLGIDDAVANMALVDSAYRAAGLDPR